MIVTDHQCKAFTPQRVSEGQIICRCAQGLQPSVCRCEHGEGAFSERVSTKPAVTTGQDRVVVQQDEWQDHPIMSLTVASFHRHTCRQAMRKTCRRRWPLGCHHGVCNNGRRRCRHHALPACQVSHGYCQSPIHDGNGWTIDRHHLTISQISQRPEPTNHLPLRPGLQRCERSICRCEHGAMERVSQTHHSGFQDRVDPVYDAHPASPCR